jgi:hypothetical protein
LFLFEDDLFWYEAEIIRNEPCAGMGQNSSARSSAKTPHRVLPKLRVELYRSSRTELYQRLCSKPCTKLCLRLSAKLPRSSAQGSAKTPHRALPKPCTELYQRLCLRLSTKLPQSSTRSSAKTPHRALPQLCMKLYHRICNLTKRWRRTSKLTHTHLTIKNYRFSYS